MVICAAAGVLLAACGGSDDGEPAARDREETTTSAIEEQAPDKDDDSASAREGAAMLAPLGDSGVSGTATLEWDSRTEVLTVTLELGGLEEGARYATLISPDCELHSGLVHQLITVDGGPDGAARATAEVADVQSIDLDGGWAVKVARPPLGEQACGTVERV